jgi:hypothetical protein
MPVEPFHEFPLAPKDRSWDASEAEKRLRKWASIDGSGDKEKVDFSKLKQCYFWHEAGKLEHFEQLKFPYCDIIDGEPHVVHNACQNALARVEHSHIPEEDKEALRRVARRQLERFKEQEADFADSIVDNSGIEIKYTKPTPEQLEKINKFALTVLSEDDVFVFKDLMIDDSLIKSHMIKIHDNLLTKFMKDAQKGIGLLMNHNSWQLPVGRSFDAYKVSEIDEDNNIVNTLYGLFYIDLNRNTESGMTTNDIVKGIMSGTIFDTSIGFKANSYTCSICGNDIRDIVKCPHVPGQVYTVERDGIKKEELCYAIVGADGNGELLENSLVFAGACDRASIQKELFSVNSVKNLKDNTKLQLIEDIKSVPVGATVYTYMAKDGVVMYYWDTNSTPNATVTLSLYQDSVNKDLRSDDDLSTEKLKELFGKYNVELKESDDIEKLVDEFVASLKVQMEEKINELTAQLSERDEKIAQLEAEKVELLKKAEIAEEYRNNLINETIEMGIRAHGNLFNEELFRKFLSTLSIEEIKEAYEKFRDEVNAKYPDGRVSISEDGTDKPLVFATDEEFRAYVAEEAKKYAEENNISLAEATKIIYKKLKESEK